MVAVDIAQLTIPLIIKHSIDALRNPDFNTWVLAGRCAAIILLGLFMTLLRFGWRNLLMSSARDVEKGLRADLFQHILTLDMAYFNRVKTGDIMAHAVSDINHVRMAFGFGIIALTDTILLGGATLTMMIWTHPKLTLMTLIPMPFLILVTRHLGKKMYIYHKTAQESFSTLTEMVRENFFGIRIIKVFNFEPLASQKVEAIAKEYFSKNLRRAVVTALMQPTLALFFNLSTLVVIFYGGYLVMDQAITPGGLVAYIQYLGLLSWPVIAIGWMINLFQRGMASLKRIETLLDATPQVRQPEQPVPVAFRASGISFSQVAFDYRPKADAGGSPNFNSVLSNISMDIPAGAKIGITGPPGSGKSSLVQLIPRLFDPTHGQIKMGGTDLKNCDMTSLREAIAFMPQESFLFSGTIQENILLGRSLDSEGLKNILHVCCLEQTLEDMPQGLDTFVGERGVTLSGGQKQRIALARTLITGKPVIILDDPISQVDTQTAATIIARMNAMSLTANIIIISHRIAALASCDRIYILKNGQLHQSGTHEKLIKSGGFYQKSYEVQQFEEARHE